MTDEKQVPGTPSGGLPGKPAGSPASPEGGAPKATDLDALRAKLGFKPATPGGPTGAPGAPGASRPGISGGPTSGAGASKPTPSVTGEFHFSGLERRASPPMKVLSAKELDELDAKVAKANKPISTKIILAVVALVLIAAAIWIGVQMGKGMSFRKIANDGIAQAQTMKTYFTQGQTGEQGEELAVKGEAAAKLKEGLENYVAENQDVLAALMDASEAGRLPDGLDWDDFKKTKLVPLKVVLDHYLLVAPPYQADEILGGRAYTPDLASEVASFVGRANSLRSSVEQLSMSLDMVMNDVTPPKALPETAEMPGKTAYVFAPNVDRNGAKVLEAALVTVTGEIEDSVLKAPKMKKTVVKEETCVKAPIAFEWTCTPCSEKAPPEVGKQDIPSYELQVSEQTVEVPLADIAGMGDGKKREIEIKHLYSVDMRPYVKPFVARFKELDERVQLDDASLHAAAAGALRVLFARLEEVQAKAATVDLKRLLDLIDAAASQEQQFVL